MRDGKLVATLTLLTVMAASGAQGELGGTMQSVRQDAEHENGTLVSIVGGAYTIATIATNETPPQLTIRQYLSGTGQVFGVAWQGNRHPNTLLLLGPYAITPDTPLLPGSVQQPRFSRRMTEQVVVEVGGTVGNVWGRAYAPSLLPAGISPDAIK
jgi:hypothetical protein